ncbi:uncharacterized protein LOC143808358 [Ranitomeya variabilis]|uniref:uncharacterized protein LOC143808358 n=1 Tax=Ranitomeya variabilis TaxID=490064 RepID=UPI0040560B23
MASGGHPEEGAEARSYPSQLDEEEAPPSLMNPEVLSAEVEELCRQLQRSWYRAAANVREQQRSQPLELRSAAEEAGTGDVKVEGRNNNPAPVTEDTLLGPVDAPPPLPPSQVCSLLEWERPWETLQTTDAPLQPTREAPDVHGEWVTFRWQHSSTNLIGFPGEAQAEGEQLEVISQDESHRQQALQQEQEDREQDLRRKAAKEKVLQAKAQARRMKYADRGPRRYGTVVAFRIKSGWGFIKEPHLYPEVFVTRCDVEPHLQEGHPDRDLYPGDRVTYTRHWGDKGWYALHVHKCALKATRSPARDPEPPQAALLCSPASPHGKVTITPTSHRAPVTMCSKSTQTVIEQRSRSTQTPIWSIDELLYVVPGYRPNPQGLPWKKN